MILEEQKYKIGEIVDINSWGGLKNDFKILDVKEVYHVRLKEYVWGYSFDKDYTGFNMTYVPEGYLRKSKTQNRINKLNRISNENE